VKSDFTYLWTSMEAIKNYRMPTRCHARHKPFIPTARKVAYIQSYCRFDSIDFGSFVSPSNSQMQDTAEVLAQLDLSQTTSKLLAVIANTQGATLASKHAEIQYLGFPFSISENFQMRNTHKTIAESLLTLQEILEIADTSNKEGGLSSMGLAILMAICGVQRS
jgi:hydroxymethylglutaryl-CoA lyase